MDSDLVYMRMAIDLAKSSRGRRSSDPLVGAVLVKEGEEVATAYRGERKASEHAEFTLLQTKLRSIAATKGATLYSTLEPCTHRNHDKKPCAQWLIDKGVRRVVIGILDPNPAICGQGFWQLRDAGVAVDFFPSDLADEIAKDNQKFIAAHRGGTAIGAAFAYFMESLKSPAVTPYDGLGVGTALSLQDHPDLRRGWPASRVLLNPASTSLRLPSQLTARYQKFFKRNYEKYRFRDDGKKFAVTLNPIAFSDSPTLTIQLVSTTYSRTIFYRDEVAPVPAFRDPLILDAVRDSLRVNFAHSFCLHAAVITSDSRLLRTRRSAKVVFHPNTWSVSVEEQLASEDLRGVKASSCGPWARRLLLEELGLQRGSYQIDQFRIQSVFLEADVLNISLCAVARIGISSAELNTILKGKPRKDHEFTEWDFVDLSAPLLLQELRSPSKAYHPTSGYRLLHVLLKEFGSPSDEMMSGIVA